MAVGKKSTKKEQNNSRQLGVHVSPRGETTARELRASGTLYTGESWTCARQKLESSKERFSNDARPRSPVLAKFVVLPTRPIKVRRTGGRVISGWIKVSDNRSSEKVLGHWGNFRSYPPIKAKYIRPWPQE